MSSKFKVFKESLVSFFSRQTFKRLYERVRYNNMSKKQRIAFICLITIIPSVAILIGILTSCIYGIDYHSVAIGVNQSTQRFIGETTWTNQVVFLSLATSLKKFPKYCYSNIVDTFKYLLEIIMLKELQIMQVYLRDL